MDVFEFEKMKLIAGSLFDFLDQKGDASVGSFIKNVGVGEFQFNNFANGEVQTIEIRNIQTIKLIRQPKPSVSDSVNIEIRRI